MEARGKTYLQNKVLCWITLSSGRIKVKLHLVDFLLESCVLYGDQKIFVVGALYPSHSNAIPPDLCLGRVSCGQAPRP